MLEPCCHRFTAAEGGARLAATAAVKNTLITECGAFISTRLLHEQAYNIRGLLSAGRQRSVRICRAVNVKPDAYELGILTDLQVTEAQQYDEIENWTEELETKEVLVCASEVLKRILEEGILTMAQINVLVIDSCHLIYKDEHLQYIMKIYKQSPEDKRPRILALTYPLFSSTKKDIDNFEIEDPPVDMQLCEKSDSQEIIDETENAIDNVESEGKKTTDKVEEMGVYENLDDFEMYEKLEWRIDQLEEELCCKMDLAEDIDGCKRISGPVTKPKEVIIEYAGRPPADVLAADYADLEHFMRSNVQETLQFLNDHRHDPTEIYGDELYEEFKNIPDPTIEPKQVFQEFLYVLEELGPYAADKAAFNLLIKIEKSKIKVPYERHFLLLRLCTTVFVKIRCYAEVLFNKYTTDWDKIRLFSTPKLLRFVEILEQFTPPDKKEGSQNQNTEAAQKSAYFMEDSKELHTEGTVNIDKAYNDPKMNTSKMLSDLEQCDFATLSDRIEDRLNTFEANLKDLDFETSVSDSVNKEDSNADPKQVEKGGFPRRWARARGRGRAPRSSAARLLQLQQNPWALCGIVFMRHALMAKIMFMLCVDLSRCRPSLTYLRCQYCAVEPVSEQRECQRQGKRHEEVLKKFRMHECNLLLTTSALEEGIDLPRCNLVLRWDIPASYRSYGLCRGRARAPRAAAAVLCAARAPAAAGAALHNLATYTELDQLITRKCGCGVQDEPSPEEESHADAFTAFIQPYTPTQQTDTQTQKTDTDCKCKDKAEKDLENRMKKINIVEVPKESDVITVEDVVKNVPKTIESVPKTIEENIVKCNPKLIEIETVISVLKSNDVHSDSKYSFVSKHLENVSDIVESVSKSIESVSKSIDRVSESIDNVSEAIESDSDVTKTFERNKISSNDIQDEIPSENIKNIEMANIKSNSRIINDIKNACDINSDKQCSCVNLSNVDTKKDSDVASVDLSMAIALINRYCAKLPSDTFTRLAPQWWTEKVRLPGAARDAYICTLRLPLNCPLKYNIVGHPMPTRVLARRMVALQACRILHKSGELDNQLMPIGKENFKAAELETANVFNAAGNIDIDDSARPGTTKRRQYYYKRTAGAFTDCQPVVDTSDAEIDPQATAAKPTEMDKSNKEAGHTSKDADGKRNMLYAIVSSLWCALPERYNTRGRRLHAPQNASQALGILMARTEPTNLQIPAFPVYTRSGEVRVCVEHVPGADARVSARRGRLVRRFMRFVFTEVLRVRRRGMKLQSEGSTKNNYYIVPTIKIIKDGASKIDIDWPFLELIYQHTEDKKLSDIEKPLLWYQDEEETSCDVAERAREAESEQEGVLSSPLLKQGEVFVFDVEKYSEAVVTPWYRNRDQPQFFLVAEICWNLSPDSAFPSAAHASFRSYYRAKYNVELTQPSQPLLDVDHTSARLNLLTPRYVNRKGVALPVSSERTRRAKRDRLDQKQILVPELCRVHPFAAPLWFATVALPCVLYRINALLIADEIRRSVARDVGLGVPRPDAAAPRFQWPPLDFGWSLSEVLNADAEKSEKKKEEEKEKERERDQKEIELRDKEHLQNQLDALAEGDEDNEDEGIQNGGKTINDILAEKEGTSTESGFEIGTWSNDMASSIPDDLEYDEMMEPLPPNLTFCTSVSGGVNWCDPIQKTKNEFQPTRGYSVADSDCSYISSDFDTDDSDFEVEGSDEDADTSGFCSSRASNTAVGVRIEYKTAHEAEAVDLERKRKTSPAPQRDPRVQLQDRRQLLELMKNGLPDEQYVKKFKNSVENHKNNIVTKGNLIKEDTAITELLPELPETKDNKTKNTTPIDNRLHEIFPYNNEIKLVDGQISLESIEKNKRVLLEKLKESMSREEIKKLNCFSMVDVDIDSPSYVNEKVMNVGFDSKEKYAEKVFNQEKREFKPYFIDNRSQNGKEFDFDYQPDLEGHPGPSPSVILQALTMSNANDGINLERLETIGDSFLKFAITAYLYCAHPTVHEGKLSHMRSKQVSNLNLYRLGRAKRLGARMIASKFEPHDNWLPPAHRAPPSPPQHTTVDTQDGKRPDAPPDVVTGCYIPYNLITQHSIPDKSIADCVEALIGAYLLECGPRGALLFMSWLGISVLPQHRVLLPGGRADRARSEEKPPQNPSPKRTRTVSSSSSSSALEWSEESQSEAEEGGDATFVGPVGARHPYKDPDGNWVQVIYGELKAPPSPLLRYIEDPEGELDQMLSGYDALERTLQYRFRDRSLLLQALTHASHQRNRLTDCYQRLEFLGDAILDYLITRHLYEDPRRHCPGALTDLRSALVNNTIFATLAVRHGFHKYFRHMSPGLNDVLTKYVKIQEENGHSISEEHYLIQEDELEQAEDVEVPKALGDLFESVAGAIFLDSGMSLGAVWQAYVRLMGAELEAFSAAAPKSPVRELLEAEPDTAKFGKPERLADGRRVRVCVEVFGRGTFKGIGRNYRIAKGTAARCALRHLRVHRR